MRENQREGRGKSPELLHFHENVVSYHFFEWKNVVWVQYIWICLVVSIFV